MAVPSNFLLEPMPHTEAAKWIASKPVVSREVFDDLLPDLRGLAFTISGIEDANVASEIRDLIAEVPAGTDWTAQKKLIAAKLGPWFADPDNDDDGKASSLARAELLLRTHGFGAYRTAAREVNDRQKDVFPFRMYLSCDDEKVRPEHRALHGLILPADSPFWHTHPGGYGCRCPEAAALLPEEVDDYRAEDKDKPLEEQRVIDGVRLRRLEQDNKLVRKVLGNDGKPLRDPIHEWNVANKDHIGAPVSMRPNLDVIKARYDDATWGEFEANAKKNTLDDGRTVWEWLNGKAIKKGKAKAEAKKVEPAKAALPAKVEEPAKAAKVSAAAQQLADLKKADNTAEMRARIESADYKSEKALGGGVNSTKIVRNGETVVHKSEAGEYGSSLRAGIKPGTQWKREIAASIVAEKLAINLVPPTGAVTWQGEIGSAQLFKAGFKTAADAQYATKPLKFEPGTRIPKDLAPQVREDWQLMDDLLMHSDRHAKNFMIKQDAAGAPAELSLIDNGLSLPANTGVLSKRFPGPAEGQRIGALNRERLTQFIAEEGAISKELADHLEPEAIAGLMARAKTLLARGTYGDFRRADVNAHLAPDMQASKIVPYYAS